MGVLRGFVDRADKMLIMGWAIDDGDPAAAPEVQIVQGGRTVVTLVPRFAFPTLRAALNLPPAESPPIYAWRFWLPLSNGLAADEPFSIVFRATGAALTHGAGRRLELVEKMDEEARRDIAGAVVVRGSHGFFPGGMDLALQVYDPRGPAARPVLAGGTRLAPRERVAPALFGRSGEHYSVRVDAAAFAAVEGPFLRVGIDPGPVGTGRERLDAEVHAVHVPRSLVNPGLLGGPLPDAANMQRVSGAVVSTGSYLVGGATVFCQIDAIARHYAGRSVREMATVVDWGVGCARVARHFREGAPGGAGPRVIGLDIDEVNIGWCRQHLAGMGEFELLSLEGFALPPSSVDLLYGISVMTHLSEHHQHRWLEEIRRVLRPGGLAILTVHGEGVNYGGTESILLPFVEAFGFFDGIADTAIGAERSDYYRATYHARRYIRANWSRYFDILDIFVMANAFSQDIVVLRK